MKLMRKVKAIKVYEGGVRAVQPISLKLYWMRYVSPTIGEIDISACPGPLPYQFWRKLEDEYIQWKWRQKERANAAIDKSQKP